MIIYGDYTCEKWNTVKGIEDPRFDRWIERIEHFLKGYSLYVFPDIKYSMDGNMFNWSEWLTSREYVTCKYAYYRGSMIWNGQKIEWGQLQDGLCVAERTWPLKKQEFSGHHYADPVKLL